MVCGSRYDLFCNRFNRSLSATRTMWDAEGLEANFDDTESTQNHRCVDMAHVGDAKAFAVQVPNGDADHDAAFLATIGSQLIWIAPTIH